MRNLSISREAAAAQELLRRRALRRDLTDWCGAIGYEPAQHHRLILAEIDALLRSDDYDTLLIFAPPGSAKSSYVSIAVPSWFMARNPSASVLAASHSVTLAEKWGRRVRNLVGDNSARLGIALADDSQAAGRWGTKSGGEYLAAGAGVGIAGFRADLGIIDDPFGSRQDAFSERIRDNIWEWFVNDFSSRLKPGAKRIVMHTRWHQDDLAGRIIERSNAGVYRTKVLSIPAIAKNDDPLGRKPGEYLWDDPSGYNYGSFLRARQKETSAAEWAALYQQDPVADGGDYFKSEWFRWYDEPPRHMRKYGASDYAVTAKGGDYTVHIVVGVDPEENIYVLDLWREQAETHVWVEQFIDMVAAHEPLLWAEESGQIIKSLGPFIDKRMRERKTYCRREQFVSVLEKTARSRAFQARASMGKVYLPHGKPWVAALLAELMSFPAGKHDDQVDALGLIGRILDQMLAGKAKKSDAHLGSDRWDRAFKKRDIDANSNWKLR